MRLGQPREVGTDIVQKGYLTLGYPHYRTSRVGTWSDQLDMIDWDDQTFIGLLLTKSTINYGKIIIYPLSWAKQAE